MSTIRDPLLGIMDDTRPRWRPHQPNTQTRARTAAGELTHWLTRADKLEGEEPGNLILTMHESIDAIKSCPEAYTAALQESLRRRLAELAKETGRCVECGAETTGQACELCRAQTRDEYLTDREEWKNR